MVKRIFTLVAGVAFLCFVGFAVYADSSGVFLQDNEAAMELVDKYMSSVMKNYMPDGSKVSFRGIIKQGCDFWYYNEYNNQTISLSHPSGSDMEVESTDYSIEYDSVSYSSKLYTICATITETVKYKVSAEPVSIVRKHVISIEQNGSEMYIINDDMDPMPNFDALMPVKETPDSPKA